MTKKQKPFRVVVVADMHVGGREALADPGESGKRDAGSPVREKLHEAWTESSTNSPWSKPDAILALGDLIEGQNRRGMATGLWTAEPMEQALHAAELLEMWGAKRKYIVRGSNYHVDISGVPGEEFVAKEIGAEVYPGQDHMPEKKRERSGWHWYLTFNGVTFHIAHHIGVSRVWHYRTTPMARELLYAKLGDGLRHATPSGINSALDEDVKYERDRTQVVLRAHAHYYNLIDYPSSTGVACPCWKGLDGFLASRGALAISPSIGFMGITIEDGEYRIEKNLWKLEDMQPAPHTTVDNRRGV